MTRSIAPPPCAAPVTARCCWRLRPTATWATRSPTTAPRRSKAEETAWQNIDPLDHIKRALVQHRVLSDEEVVEHCQAMSRRIGKATIWAVDATDPDPADIYEGLWVNTTSDGIGDEYRTPASELVGEVTYTRRDRQGRILYRHAVAEALMEEMLRDRRVICYGEDVADYGGAFGATRGLIEVFGRGRVFNAPISEAAIVGTAAGASMVGMRPVAEIMYIDFILMTMDQTGNQLAKNRYMFGGKATLPAVIRTTIGGGRGYAGQHSQSLEAVVTQFPGLKVVAPAFARDVEAAQAAIRDDNPVIFIEHQHCYAEKGEVPEGLHHPAGRRQRGLRQRCEIIAYATCCCALWRRRSCWRASIEVEVVDRAHLFRRGTSPDLGQQDRPRAGVQQALHRLLREHIAHRVMGALGRPEGAVYRRCSRRRRQWPRRWRKRISVGREDRRAHPRSGRRLTHLDRTGAIIPARPRGGAEGSCASPSPQQAWGQDMRLATWGRHARGSRLAMTASPRSPTWAYYVRRASISTSLWR